MTSSWHAHFPQRLGALPLGGDLVRTDPSGPSDARILLLGVYPAATAWKNAVVKGQPAKLPVAVEQTSFEKDSHAGQELDLRYLAPLGLGREQVLLADLWPYFTANTYRESGRASMADSIRAYHKETHDKTAVVPRPSANELLAKVRTAPGSLDRLRELLQGRQLVITLGNEPAAFVRGLSKAADAQPLLYCAPEKLQVTGLGLTTTFVHLTHPGNGHPEWQERHQSWCQDHGRALVQAVLSSAGT